MMNPEDLRRLEEAQDQGAAQVFKA
jgi:hypothetical protein